jgi:hypothetical protein
MQFLNIIAVAAARSTPAPERRAVDSCDGLVLVADPAVDTAATVGAELSALGPPVAMEQVRRSSVQPRQDAPACTTACPLRESECERLRGKLIG